MNQKRQFIQQSKDNCSETYSCEGHKNTILKKSVFFWVDGARYKVPLPERTSEGKWKINKDGIEYKIAKLFKQYYPLEKILPNKGVEIE